jgi:alpha-beta hydrolase superfamily lysophospholipase
VVFRADAPVAGLLYVHGMQSHAGWTEASGTAAELAAAGITGLAYDRRGSGRSGGLRGHATSADDFLEDLRTAIDALRQQLDDSGAADAPIHVLANCFGSRAVLTFVGENPGVFQSLVLTAPATHMSRRGSYPCWKRGLIALAPPETYFATPLRDADFVSSGPWLKWIRRDELGLRGVTAAFLRAAAALTARMEAAIPRLRAPLLVVLGRRDVLVDNDLIRDDFFAPYSGRKELLEYDTEHYVDFTDAQPDFASRLQEWILAAPSRMKWASA